MSLAVGLRQETIARFENDKAVPREAQLRSIAAHTGVTKDFFTKRPIIGDVGEALAYRCRSRVPVKDKNQARQYILLLAELLQDLCTILRPPPLTIPSVNMEPGKAARYVRTVLGLSADGPIGHVVNTLERNGAVVFAFPVDTRPH